MTRVPDVPVRPLALPLLLVWAAGGCDLLGAGSDPETARARVTSEEEVVVRIVTSTQFTATRQAGGGASVELLRSDTVVGDLPYDRSRDISESRRFFATVEAADTAGVPVTLEAFVDGIERFRRTVPVGEEPLTFIFRSR